MVVFSDGISKFAVSEVQYSIEVKSEMNLQIYATLPTITRGLFNPVENGDGETSPSNYSSYLIFFK